MNIWPQGPNAKRDYRLTVVGDTIADADWSITPTGPTLGTPVNETTQSTVRVSGIEQGKGYVLGCHIVMGTGQEDDGYCQIEGRTT